MSFRFIIGRAGTGKTRHCVEAVRDRLRADPVDGPRLVLLVPEQASFQMERAILEGYGVRGSHRAEVLSFQRLAFRLIESAGVATRQAISEPARAMVLRHVVHQLAPALRYYRSVERFGGFAEQMGRTIAELIQENVHPDDLAPAAAAAPPDDPLQAARLSDLQLIYAAYLDHLGSDRLDPSQYLEVARSLLPRCAWLAGAEVWVDGFASMSQQETLTLIELCRIAAHVDMTMLDDPAACDPSPGDEGQEGDVGRLFGRTRRTWRLLHRQIASAGIRIEEPLRLMPPAPPRFRKNPTLVALERDLFAPRPADPPQADGAADVEIAELPTRRIEVDYAVAKIMRWVSDPRRGYRYRDIAIIVRDLAPYYDLITAALASRHIPFFIDRRRPIGHHPLVELLRAAVSAAESDCSLESMRLLLKTGLVLLRGDVSDSTAADELENYLLAHGVAGAAAWHREWRYGVVDIPAGGHGAGANSRETARQQHRRAERDRVNKSRRRLLGLLDPWLAAGVAAQRPTGRDWAAAALALFDRLEVARTLAAWAAQAEDDGDLDQAEEHRQVWRDALAFLDDLAFALRDTPLAPAEFAQVLDAGLSQLTLGLAPPTIDQILVGSIERSRHPDLKAVVVLGVNDGLFPSVAQEEAILGDDDRALLAAAGLHVAPPSRQRTLDEPLLTYIAVTRPSEALVLTCAAADERGRELRPSPHLAAIQSACPSIPLRRPGDPARAREFWDVLTPSDAIRRLTTEFRERPARGEDDLGVRAAWNSLYTAIRDEPAMRRAMHGFAPARPARLSPASVARLVPDTLHTSVSRLEDHATCPFKHFAVHVLDLQERTEAVLQPVDVGKVHHAILEDFVLQLTEGGRDFAPMTDADLLRELDDSAARVAAGLPKEGLLTQAREAYVMRRSQTRLARVLMAQRTVSAAGLARPKRAELAFGLSEDGLHALELTTPKGRHVRLRGVMDRVDLAEVADEMLGIVVDYKLTRNKKLSLTQAYHGLSLQLVAYLLVLQQHGHTLAGRPIRPIASFYVSLTPQYARIDHPLKPVSEKENALGAHAPRGLIDAGMLEVLERDFDGQNSKWFSVQFKKDGTLGYLDRSDGAQRGDFDAVLAHVRGRLGELADGVLDGDIAVLPYRLGTLSPCSWCPMLTVCRFDAGRSDVRFLETLKRSEALARMRPPA
jgi:ATP-dependent helicase/nuclease subunit B